MIDPLTRSASRERLSAAHFPAAMSKLSWSFWSSSSSNFSSAASMEIYGKFPVKRQQAQNKVQAAAIFLILTLHDFHFCSLLLVSLLKNPPYHPISSKIPFPVGSWILCWLQKTSKNPWLRLIFPGDETLEMWTSPRNHETEEIVISQGFNIYIYTYIHIYIYIYYLYV